MTDARGPATVARDRLVAGVAAAVAAVPAASWGVSIRCDGEQVVAIDPEAVLPSASMGKVLLLIAAAQALESGERAPGF